MFRGRQVNRKESEKGLTQIRGRRRERLLPGHSGNLSWHPTRKSGQDNISKLRRTQTWKKHPRGRPLSAPCFTRFLFSSPLSSLPAAPPLFFSFSFYPSLRAAAFESVCAECLGRGPGGEKAKELVCAFHPIRVTRSSSSISFQI